MTAPPVAFLDNLINILNSCPTQSRVEVRDAMKPLYYRTVSSKGAGRPRLTHHHKGWWNGTKWMRWVFEKWWNEICGRGKREKPREKPTQTPFRPPRNPHGVTETRTRDPSGGSERLTACATRPLDNLIKPWNITSNYFSSKSREPHLSDRPMLPRWMCKTIKSVRIINLRHVCGYRLMVLRFTLLSFR